MTLQVSACYQLDALNFLNVLTEDDFYVNRHSEDYDHFKRLLGDQHKSLISELVRIQGSTMLSPYLTLVVSAYPDFESAELSEILRSVDTLHQHFRETTYFDAEVWEKGKARFELAADMIVLIEKHGFKPYWQERKLPLLKQKGQEIEKFASAYSVFDEINGMLGPYSRLNRITLFLCAFVAPHGIKIVGPRYISDVAYRMQLSLGIAIHEMFHPPYQVEQLDDRLEMLKQEALLVQAFYKQKDRFSYTTIEGFIEENVVEAMALHICGKLGLENDLYAYLEQHDEGSHVLSIILLDYLDRVPKRKEDTFQSYFNGFLRQFRFGSMEEEVARIRNHHMG